MSSEKNLTSNVVWTIFQAIIAAIIAGGITIYFTRESISDPSFWNVLLCLLNLLVIFLIPWLIKPTPVEIRFKEPNGIKSYEKDYNLKSSTPQIEPITINKKVNSTVRQFTINIYGYIVCLVPVYLLSIFFKPIGPSDVVTNDMKLAFIVIDIFNYFSACFIFLNYKVLHDETLDKYGNTKPYWWGVAFFTMFYASIYFLLTVFYDDKYSSNLLSLIAGFFNGFNMMLLFSRYISMELMVRKHDNNEEGKRKYTSFETNIIIYVLPFYAVVQVLFGTFRVDIFAPADIFRDIVFFICLIGKIAFIYVTYIFINKKLMHLFLHRYYTRNDITDSEDGECFEL
jgi:MFS family permease